MQPWGFKGEVGRLMAQVQVRLLISALAEMSPLSETSHFSSLFIGNCGKSPESQNRRS